MTNSGILRYTAALAALIMCPAANAADGHWLFGGAVGYTALDESIASVRLQSASTSIRVYGGFQFNDYFAVEFGYLDLGDFDELIVAGGNSIVISAEADGFTFAASGHVPLGERFSLHGSIGSFFWDGETSINGLSTDPGNINLFFGAGLKFSVTPALSLRTDIAHYDLDDVDVSVLTLGLQFDFN